MQFEIKIDDIVRSHRDVRATAIEVARFLAQRSPGAIADAACRAWCR